MCDWGGGPLGNGAYRAPEPRETEVPKPRIPAKDSAEVIRLRRENRELKEKVAELKRNGAKSTLEVTREGLRRFGTPPPGEGTHPLQGHRDSMG